jgi:phosphatidylserine decarboxylase
LRAARKAGDALAHPIMAREPIQFFNRYTRQIETEDIYGETWMRLVYENPVGRLLLWALVKRKFFSWYYGRRMNRRWSGSKIFPFVVKYNLDADEFAKDIFKMRTFNEFFSRALKREARPVAGGGRVVVFPADGRHLAFPDVDAAEGFYVKGSKFTLAELLGEGGLPEAGQTLARKFAGGAMLISRLCPVDYHRFHFPCAGTPDEARLIKGFLYSVSPIALRRNIEYLVRNKRMLTMLETPDFGTVAMLEVGATNVGAIMQMYVENRPVAKGEEKGFFKFGGSCVITLFERGRIRFDADLIAQSRECRETYARMGDRLGEAV